MEKDKESKETPQEEADFSQLKINYSKTDIRSVYKFIKVVGGGHFGSVRLAHRKTDPELNYAVKSILKSSVKKGEVQLLENELKILQEVDHPNIAKFFETYIDGRYVHIVMELCTGGELFERIMEYQRFSEKEAAKIMRKIVSAVKHLHEN